MKKTAICLLLALALGTGACSKSSDKASKATATTASSTSAGVTPTSAAPQSGPVTDADVTEADQILHRLDTELDRLDSDMATGEGEVQ